MLKGLLSYIFKKKTFLRIEIDDLLFKIYTIDQLDKLCIRYNLEPRIQLEDKDVNSRN